MSSTSSTASSLFVLISSQPTPFFPVSRRVDMDIAGTSNSLLRTNSKQEEVPRPWLDEDSDWGKTVIEQKIIKEYIENENDALLRYPPNFSGGYSFVNRDITNAWGYPRGYLIHPGNSPIFNVRFLVHFRKFLYSPIRIDRPFFPLDGCRFQEDVEKCQLGTVQPCCFSSQRNRAFIEYNVESKSAR